MDTLIQVGGLLLLLGFVSWLVGGKKSNAKTQSAEAGPPPPRIDIDDADREYEERLKRRIAYNKRIRAMEDAISGAGGGYEGGEDFSEPPSTRSN